MAMLNNQRVAIENCHGNSGLSHEKWWILPEFFVNVYQRVAVSQ